MEIYKLINSLLAYGKEKNIYLPKDYYYVRNSLLSIFKLSDYSMTSIYQDRYLYDILDEMIEYAINNGIIEDSQVNKDLFDTKIMGALTPMPSYINHSFHEILKKDSAKALDYFYNLCINTNYIRFNRIKKDILFKYLSPVGQLDISINLAKPEKDPADIKKLLSLKKSSYPLCMLCKENVNYEGRLDFPARQNLRYVDITLNNNLFHLQYSPYSYYHHHAIVFSDEHKPMEVDIEAIKELADFVDMFPTYFIGSNAGLPIVGGSILNHHHFQGGKANLPMENAKEHLLKDEDNVQYHYLDWPLSVIRLKSTNRNSLLVAAERAFDKWKDYHNEKLFIISVDETGPHNAITPIIRKKDNVYTLDLVLRNNITTADRPLGYYHPRPEYFHIKKENIGLIEVMGLAILPSRLAKEMELVKKYLLNDLTQKEQNDIKTHLSWADELKRKNKITLDNVDKIIQNGIGDVFYKVLQDCAVFKENNLDEFIKFIINI